MLTTRPSEKSHLKTEVMFVKNNLVNVGMCINNQAPLSQIFGITSRGLVVSALDQQSKGKNFAGSNPGYGKIYKKNCRSNAIISPEDRVDQLPKHCLKKTNSFDSGGVCINNQTPLSQTFRIIHVV